MSMTTEGQTQSISREEAPTLAETAYVRFAQLLATVREDQWELPTDCEGWTVRDLAGHMVGALRSAASLRQLAHQQLVVARRRRIRGGNPTDIMTALQIEIARPLTPEQVVAECAGLARPAAQGRAGTPGLLRRQSFPVEFGTTRETWQIGYVVDVVLTRDAWLHRIDLARALGVQPVLDDKHDGRIVADVVTEWARRHGQPVQLDLRGPAGGRFAFGGGRPREVLDLDAVEFCRALSGRGSRSGLLEVDVPF